MIDIHTHILPGIDDGARDMAESVAMARMASADGVRTMVATPHHYPLGTESPLARGRRLRDAVVAQSGVDLDILVGQEMAAEPTLPELVGDGLFLPIEGTRYVLVEPPFEGWPAWVDDVLDRLQAGGFRPILAHPERNSTVQREPDVLMRLVRRGVLCQVNTGSVLGDYGKGAQASGIVLLKRQFVHILASDAHSADGARQPNLSAGLTAVGEVVGAARARAMVTTVPQAIIEGRDVEAAAPL